MERMDLTGIKDEESTGIETGCEPDQVSAEVTG